MSKKLTFSDQTPISLKRGRARCNFCNESNDSCIQGLLLLVAKYQYPKLMQGNVIIGYPDSIKTFFRGWVRVIEGREFKQVLTGWEEKEVTDSANICPDCVRQLAALLAKEK